VRQGRIPDSEEDRTTTLGRQRRRPRLRHRHPRRATTPLPRHPRTDHHHKRHDHRPPQPTRLPTRTPPSQPPHQHPHPMVGKPHLFGLMAFLGSMFAAAWIDESVPDRNISTADIRSIPVPPSDQDWRKLSSVGEQLLYAPFTELGELLHQLDEIVWSSMKIDHQLREIIMERFANFTDPGGIIRNPSTRTKGVHRDTPSFTSRNTFGATRDVRSDEIQVVIPGLTEEEGLWIRPPGRMSGWMLQPGSTFAAQVPESERFDDVTFAYQKNSWLDDQELESRVRALQSSDQS
jgi:hypothetical protein